MKKRTGWVSNSSSSSFIVGIAEITDTKKLKEYLASYPQKDLDDCNVTILEAGKEVPRSYDFTVADGRLRAEAWVNSSPGVALEYDPEKNYFIFIVGNNEGDSEFWDGEDLDYSVVDEGWFDEVQGGILQDVFLGGLDFIGKSEYRLGADRNG